MKLLSVIALLCGYAIAANNCPEAKLPDITFEEAVLALTGVGDVSQLPQEDMENFAALAEKPLEINRCSKAALLASGLFSEYQAAALTDWRARHGDILSEEELGVIDGFGEKTARAAGRFVSFAAGRGLRGGGSYSGQGQDGTMGGDRSGPYTDWEATALGGVKADGGTCNGMAGIKASVGITGDGGKFSASVAGRTQWGEALPQELGWNLSWENGRVSSGFRPAITSVSAGCFNARFGQGLLCWTGTRIESYSSPSALMLRPTGIAPYKSWSPSNSMSGAAIRADIGRLSIRSFIDLSPVLTSFKADWEGMRYGGNVAWNHKNGQAGISLMAGSGDRGISADFQQTFQGTVIYGEACYKLPSTGASTTATPSASAGGFPPDISALLGATSQLGNAAIGLRLMYSTNEYNATAAASYDSPDRSHRFNLGTTASYCPVAKGHTPKGAVSVKVCGEYAVSVSGGWSFTTKATGRLSRRYEIRQDIGRTIGPFSATLRLDAVRGKSFAGMAYLEGGWNGTHKTRLSFNIFLQGGLFRADNWDDRIYVYMRDTPGTFSIPAMYGRGWWSSIYAKAKFGKHFSLYLKVMYTAYPWARPEDSRTGQSFTGKIQLVVS